MTSDPILSDRNPEARDVGEEIAALARVLADVAACEWRRSETPRLWESERGGSGEIRNETAEIALDARRLALRVATWNAYRTVVSARHDLERALAAWRGEKVSDA